MVFFCCLALFYSSRSGTCMTGFAIKVSFQFCSFSVINLSKMLSTVFDWLVMKHENAVLSPNFGSFVPNPVITRTPDNSKPLWFHFKVRAIGSNLCLFLRVQFLNVLNTVAHVLVHVHLCLCLNGGCGWICKVTVRERPSGLKTLEDGCQHNFCGRRLEIYKLHRIPVVTWIIQRESSYFRYAFTDHVHPTPNLGLLFGAITKARLRFINV